MLLIKIYDFIQRKTKNHGHFRTSFMDMLLPKPPKFRPKNKPYFRKTVNGKGNSVFTKKNIHKTYNIIIYCFVVAAVIIMLEQTLEH